MDNNSNMNQNPNVDPNMGKANGGSAGPLIAAIVILAVIILGGLYFWGERSGDETDRMVEDINSQSNSDDTSSIEADLESTDLDAVDAELNAS